MGLFDAVMGNASEVKIEDVQKDFGRLLAPNEKIEYHSIPYRSIHYSINTLEPRHRIDNKILFF